MTVDVVFLLFYLLFVFCVIYPPTECVAFGLTIPNIFSGWLGSEHQGFIGYQIRRTNLTLFVYSLLPLGFVLGSIAFGSGDGIESILLSENLTINRVLLTTAIILPILSLYQIQSYGNASENHPIVRNLKKFANNNSDWKVIASDINAEYRSIDKLVFQTNPISHLITTENWVIKVNPLSVFVAHLSDAQLIVKLSDSHGLSHLATGVTQYLTIEVKSSRAGVFKFRLNTLDFKDLQDRHSRTIEVLPEVKFFKTIIEEFIPFFRETIERNPTYKTTQELDHCFGCSQVVANVKLQKFCEDSGGNNCDRCYCKPMWCVDCMGSWFAHKQDPENKRHWLRGKCPCPMCKKTFCLLDVCLVETE